MSDFPKMKPWCNYIGLVLVIAKGCDKCQKIGAWYSRVILKKVQGPGPIRALDS